MNRAAWSSRLRPYVSGWTYPGSREILESEFFDAVSGTPIDVTDTASLALTEATEAAVQIGVTDTASLSAADTGAVLLAVEVSDSALLALTESGSVEQIDGSLETTEERPAGGYGAANEYAAAQQRKRARERADRLWTDDDEAELRQLLQSRIAQASTDDDLTRIRALVAEYASGAQAEYLTRRGQRAIEYAQRAQTELALRLAAREIERFEEDAITALLVLALDA